MSLVMPKPTENSFETPPAGTHMAVCYRVIDLGTQDVEFQGQRKKQHKIMLSWELPDEKMSDGRPFSMHQKYTLSSSEKATLRKHLEAWRGKPFTDDEFGTFDLKSLIGVGCLMNVLHNQSGGKTYANIGGVMTLPKGQKAPSATNESLFFSLNAFDENAFQKLSENLKQAIMKAPEYGKHAVLREDAIPDHDEDSEDDNMSDPVPF